MYRSGQVATLFKRPSTEIQWCLQATPYSAGCQEHLYHIALGSVCSNESHSTCCVGVYLPRWKHQEEAVQETCDHPATSKWRPRLSWSVEPGERVWGALCLPRIQVTLLPNMSDLNDTNPQNNSSSQMKSRWLYVSFAWAVEHTGHHLLGSSPLCMTVILSRWKTHKWRRCQLVPWLVRQDSPGAQETCGPGMQVRGMESHSLEDNDSTTCSQGGAVVASEQEGCGFDPSRGLFYVQFACWPCLGSLLVLWLPSKVRLHVLYVRRFGNCELPLIVCLCGHAINLWLVHAVPCTGPMTNPFQLHAARETPY